MESPTARYIITRAILAICLLVALMIGINFYKKRQRQSLIASELRTITSDGSYFQQFYAEEASKSLLRAIALIGEARRLGVTPEQSIDRAIGLKEGGAFASDTVRDEITPRQQVVRHSLQTNWTSFLKLGYDTDFATLQTFREGRIPPIPTGPEAGKPAEIGTIIDPALSPGLEKVIANLELRPARPANHQPTDIEIAAAKKFANDLVLAGILEQQMKDKIIEKLSGPVAEEKQ